MCSSQESSLVTMSSGSAQVSPFWPWGLGSEGRQVTSTGRGGWAFKHGAPAPVP